MSWKNQNIMASKERQSFVMYASFLEAAENLEPAAFKECVLKLRDFALFGNDVSSKDPLVNIILTMAKPNLNAAAERYQRCVENGDKGKGHGSKGGRPRKGETREEYMERKLLTETPRKPLNVDEDANEKEKENENKKEKENVEIIQSPGAMEPSGGSGTNIGFSSFISVESIFPSDSPTRARSQDVSLILQSHSGLSDDELERRFYQVIDKIASARTNNTRLSNEQTLVMEAALICKRFDKLPTIDDAIELVVRDINAAIQQIVEASEDESEVPF